MPVYSSIGIVYVKYLDQDFDNFHVHVPIYG